jgi:hypothetical protein
LSALYVQIGEKVLTLNTLNGAPHTQTRSHKTNALLNSFSSSARSPSWRSAGHHFIKFDQKGKHGKSWIVTKNDE